MKSLLRSQRGGVTLIMVLAFMALGVPVVASTLNMANTFARDSRSKRDILERHYCALAVGEYIRYLTLSSQRWADWWTAHPDGRETIGPCGDAAPTGIPIEINRLTDSPVGTDTSVLLGSLSLLPPPAYSNRRVQSLKTVIATDPAQSVDQTPFIYTVTFVNRSDKQANLNKVHDVLPPGLQYNCAITSTILMPDGITTNALPPEPDFGGTGCPTDPHVIWNVSNIPGGITLQSRESAVLTFQASRSGGFLSAGNYCNEAWAEAGDDNTSTGRTAPVKVGGVGPDDNVCVGEGPGVRLTKSVSKVLDVTPTGSSPPFDTYELTVEYTITIENVGSVPLNLGPDGSTRYGLRDLLPLDFCYVGSSTLYQGLNPGDPKTNIPKGSKLCPDPNTRQRLDWEFADEIPSGATRTMTYLAGATVSRGDYWSDLEAKFAEFSGPAIYTWPTAAILVRDEYEVSATLDGQTIGTFSVFLGISAGGIHDWEIY